MSRIRIRTGFLIFDPEVPLVREDTEKLFADLELQIRGGTGVNEVAGRLAAELRLRAELRALIPPLGRTF